MSDAWPPDAGDRTPSIQSLATNFAWMLFALSALLLLFFAWPGIWSELEPVFAKIQPEQIRNFTVLSYFASWMIAMFVDLRIQSAVYQADPSKNRLSLKGLGVAATLFVVGVILILSRTTAGSLAFALNVFFLTNILAWLQVKRLVRPIILSSRHFYIMESSNHPALAQLDILAAYITGKWHWHRFMWMLVIIAVVDIISFSTTAREGMAGYLYRAFPDVPVGRIGSLLPDLAVLLFVTAAEAWSWAQRIIAAVSAGQLINPSTSDHPRLAEYMNQFFDQQFKAVNYLMIAHAAALLATLTLVKDYLASLKNSTSPIDLILVAPKDAGSFVALFAWGLALAILGYTMLSIARDNVMSAILLDLRKALDQKSSYLAWIFCTGSTLLLLAGVLTVASRVGGIGIPL